MVGALWTGISGLSGAQRALDNESNNIANVNTLGYKASRIAFADQMYQDDIGKGVSTFDVEKLYTQGNLKVTGVSYDMALSGDGFFQVSDGNDFFYSRAGNFRMGQSGELENAGGYAVQGWAMAAIDPDEDVVSTDENVSLFTSSYNKLIGNAIFRNSTDITTKVAKATDYTESAVADGVTVFTGASQKTASTKISDVELLITEYNNQLTLYNNAEPKPASTESKSQRNLLDYNLDAVALDTGDEMYVYIDGTKYSQSFDTDEMTTFKLLADKISNVSGLKAYLTDGIGEYGMDTQDTQGKLLIEGLIPGKQFSVTEFGWTDATNDNQATKGTVEIVQDAVQGTGLTAIKNIEEALADAISGKQKDVYTPADLFNIDTIDNLVLGDHTFSYTINVYDKEKGENIPVPNDGGTPPMAVPLTMTNIVTNNMDTMTAIDMVVGAINGDSSLSKYVKAENVNGNLVVKTLDSNSDVEFTSTMKKTNAAVVATADPAIAEVERIKFSNPTGPGTYTFDGETVTITETDTAYDVAEKVATALRSAGSYDNAIAVGDELIITKAGAAFDGTDIGALVGAAGTTGISFTQTEVIQAKDALAAATPEEQTIQFAAGNTTGAGNVTIAGVDVAVGAGVDQDAVAAAVAAAKDSIMATNANIADITVAGDTVTVTYKAGSGDVANATVASAVLPGAATVTETVTGTTTGTNSEVTSNAAADTPRNATYSGRDGASAEFLSMTTIVNQAATKSDIQLRLDTLNLTDSAFGDFSVDATGLITMTQNGAQFAVGQVAIAKFTDNRGLEAVGNNLLKATNRSGQAIFNMDNKQTAEIKGGTLELSTSDLSESLVNLMVFQRAFEANSKSITTSDQILTTLIQMKR